MILFLKKKKNGIFVKIKLKKLINDQIFKIEISKVLLI